MQSLVDVESQQRTGRAPPGGDPSPDCHWLTPILIFFLAISCAGLLIFLAMSSLESPDDISLGPMTNNSWVPADNKTVGPAGNMSAGPADNKSEGLAGNISQVSAAGIYIRQAGLRDFVFGLMFGLVFWSATTSALLTGFIFPAVAPLEQGGPAVVQDERNAAAASGSPNRPQNARDENSAQRNAATETTDKENGNLRNAAPENAPAASGDTHGQIGGRSYELQSVAGAVEEASDEVVVVIKLVATRRSFGEREASSAGGHNVDG